MLPLVPASCRVVFPLPQGTRVTASPFGMRIDPITGVTKLHPSADDRTPIIAAADGIVTAEQRIGNVVSTGYSPRWPLQLRPHRRQTRQPAMNIFLDVNALDDQI
ncbi:hypothetical protein CUAC110507_05120 [Cutibacterium acnes subsp. defendens]|jgi:hypothetical protein|nr:metalloendopeptidase-like membrane protein [Cutibacterium acnes P15]MCU7485193.1 metalloendopeptidase-like membrane protein [Cutibacterium acnes 19B2]MCU7487503.1 metalloendopeptidase-like membrane protein [Cutibacterium acnes 19B1]